MDSNPLNPSQHALPAVIEVGFLGRDYLKKISRLNAANGNRSRRFLRGPRPLGPRNGGSRGDRKAKQHSIAEQRGISEQSPPTRSQPHHLHSPINLRRHPDHRLAYPGKASCQSKKGKPADGSVRQGGTARVGGQSRLLQRGGRGLA